MPQTLDFERLRDLAAALAPIADAALASHEPDVEKVAVVLAALMGAIDGDAVDRQVLDTLAIQAGLICEHRIGKHGTA